MQWKWVELVSGTLEEEVSEPSPVFAAVLVGSVLGFVMVACLAKRPRIQRGLLSPDPVEPEEVSVQQ